MDTDETLHAAAEHDTAVTGSAVTGSVRLATPTTERSTLLHFEWQKALE